MKKFIKVSLILVVVFMLLQAVIGGAFVSADKMAASFENPQYVTAPSSGAGIQVLICAGSRSVNCVMPHVGWNS